MADLRPSELTAATAVTDPDILLMSQSGASKKLSIAILKAFIQIGLEQAANKGQAGGYAPLGSDSKIAATYLPSYVDDVLEYASYAALPAAGETGKIYVTLDTNFEYRWSGSTYIRLVSSPGSTDALAEGTSNLYFTAARVLASVLTGYTVGGNTALAASDSVLSALQKIQGQLNNRQALDANLTSTVNMGHFRKSDPTIVAFAKTGAFTVSTAVTLYVEVNGNLKTIASSTAVTMPGSAVAGTDYAIWAKTDGSLEATTSHTSPPTANARKIGGFHYAPGGNATGTSGGDTTPAINAYSFWDLKFRPACPDPRGMTLVGGGFWCDIYLTNTDTNTNGTSKYNVTIADGSSPPKIPTQFGGNGTTAYSSLTWFEANEVAHSAGKRPLYQSEFMAAMYGTTEGASIGSDQGSTILNAAYTSKFGVIQATGVMWVWGQERGGAYGTTGWNANTNSRGQEYNAPNAAFFGGYWGDGASAGSRSSAWSSAASDSASVIGLRCACDHLILD